MKYAITRVCDADFEEVIFAVELTQDLANRVGQRLAAVRALKGSDLMRASFWESVKCFTAKSSSNGEANDANAAFDAVDDCDYTVVDSLHEDWVPCHTSAALLHMKPDGFCYWTFRVPHLNSTVETMYVDLMGLLAKHGLHPESDVK